MTGVVGVLAEGRAECACEGVPLPSCAPLYCTVPTRRSRRLPQVRVGGSLPVRRAIVALLVERMHAAPALAAYETLAPHYPPGAIEFLARTDTSEATCRVLRGLSA